MRRVVLAGIAAVMLVFSVGATSSAAADVQRLDVSGSVTSCDGKTTLTMSGFTQIVTKDTTDGAGGTHTGFHLKTHLQGTDTNGIKYVDNHEETIVLNKTSGVQEFTTHDHVNLNGQGQASNWLVQEIGHYTLHPDSTLSANFFFINESCR